MATEKLVRHNSGFLNVAPTYSILENDVGYDEQNGDRLETYNLPVGFKVCESQIGLLQIYDKDDNQWVLCCTDDWKQAAVASANGIVKLDKVA